MYALVSAVWSLGAAASSSSKVSGGRTPACFKRSVRYTINVLSATKGRARMSPPAFMGAMAPARKSAASRAGSLAMNSFSLAAQPAPIHFPEKMKVIVMTSKAPDPVDSSRSARWL